MIPGSLQVRNVQECDSKGVVGDESVRRTPANRSSRAADCLIFCENGSRNISFTDPFEQFAIDGEKSEPMSDDSETGHHRDELGAILFADGGET